MFLELKKRARAYDMMNLAQSVQKQIRNEKPELFVRRHGIVCRVFKEMRHDN